MAINWDKVNKYVKESEDELKSLDSRTTKKYQSGGTFPQLSTGGGSSSTGGFGALKTFTQSIADAARNVSPQDKKTFREDQFASSTVSTPEQPRNVSRELSFARRARAGSETIKKLQEEQNAYLEQQRKEKASERDFWDDFWWGLGYGAERIGADILGAGENLTDAVGSGFWGAVSGLSSLGGMVPNPVSEYAGQQAEAFLQNSVSQDWKKSIEERYKPQDWQRTVGDIEGAVASMLPSIGAAVATGGTSASGQIASGVPKLLPTGSDLGRAVMGVQAIGSGAQEAFQEGADLGQALSYGAASGLLETMTESLVGGIPGLGKGAASELVSKVVSNPVVQKAVDTVGEGGEEAISTIVTPYLKRALYDPDAENATLDEIAQSAVMGMVVSGVLQGGIELPRALSTRSDLTKEASANLDNPEFVQRTTEEAINRFNQNVNNRPVLL